MRNFLVAARRMVARLGERREVARWRAAHVAHHTHLAPNVHVLGWRHVRIGHHTVISEDTWLNVNHRGGTEVAIAIGNHCFLGRRNFLSAGATILIEDYCLTGIDCHFLGADHLHETPFRPYVATGTTTDGIIELGANCWLGSSVTVLKNVKIGFGSIIGAAAVVTRDVPPLSVAVGNPARVIRRFDVRRDCWVSIAEYPVDGDEHLPEASEYLAKLGANPSGIKLPVRASSGHLGDL